ncbi:MAG TPA: STAS domain-containing protein [Micromonosporaceae bacterium]|nr:STAS domain-containing protein [Micromonosporaceae bacterium]
MTVTGDVDMATAPMLREALQAADGRPLIVDLSGTSFLDSAGVAVLFDYAGDGLELVLTPDSVVTLVLEVTGLTKAARIRYSAGPALDDHQ